MNDERRISFRITDSELIKKLDSRISHSKVPISTYVRDLIENDLQGKTTVSPHDSKCLEELVSDFYPIHSQKAAKLLSEVNQPLLLMRMLEGLIDKLEHSDSLKGSSLPKDFGVYMQFIGRARPKDSEDLIFEEDVTVPKIAADSPRKYTAKKSSTRKKA